MNELTLQLLDKLRNVVKDQAEYCQQTIDARHKYAERYSYEAVVKYRYSGDEVKAAEAAGTAMWHDGSCEGHQMALHCVVTIQKAVIELELALNQLITPST